MKKRIIVIVVCIALLFTAIGVGVGASILASANNLTQDDMVNILNISRQAYSNYETLNRTPDIDTLILLADYYKISLNDLVLCNISDDYIPFEGLAEKVTPYIFSKNPKSDTSIYLSEEELEMILHLRNLTPEKQELIKSFLLHE